MKIRTIETARLRLRSFTRADADFAISIWNDPEMGEYLPDEAMEEIDEAYRKEIEGLEDAEDCCYLIAEAKDSRERIGTCSFIVSDDGKTYDIAYCVHKAHWGNGYATEMAGGLIARAKEQGADRITVRVNRENAASNRVVGKLGFKAVGERSCRKRGTDREFIDLLYERNV